MTEKFKQRFVLEPSLTVGLVPRRILHLHRLFFFGVALVFALTLASSVEHTRAGTSPAPTNSTKPETSGTGGSPMNHAQDARATIKQTEKSATGESNFTKLDGTRIHYVNYGKGSEALVLIHGWTCNLDNWRDQFPDFARRNRVIAIDLPGHGLSDKPQLQTGKGALPDGRASAPSVLAYGRASAPSVLAHGRASATPAVTNGQPFVYSMDLFARAVDAVLRDAKVKRAVLVGHSMGTPIARQFYRKYPEKTLAIVIVDGPLRPFGDKAMMDSLAAGFRAPTYREAVGKMFAGMFGPGLPAEAKERIKASYLNTPQHVLVSAMEGMADPSIWGDDKINVPVLAIMARNPFFGPDLEQRYRSIAPNMEFHIWDGVGHFIMMEKPKEFNEAVLQFLDKNRLLKK